LYFLKAIHFLFKVLKNKIANFDGVKIIYKGEETNYYMHNIEFLERFLTPADSMGTKP
jgi:hypothetical protein